MFRPKTYQRIGEELARGQAAREQGFEGRARVCARRAAGEAVRAYLEARGETQRSASAYDLLADLRDRPELPEEARQRVDRLLLKVDEGFALPEGMDLLVDARELTSLLERMTA